MFLDPIERQEFDDAKLARIHPEAYEATLKARREWNPVKTIASFFRNLFSRKSK